MNCLHPIRIKNPYTHEYMFVPCGKCEGCAITRANSLSRRISNELLNHQYNLFFTLTYDNTHMPYLMADKDGVVDTIYNVCSIHTYSYLDEDGKRIFKKCTSASKVKLDYSFDDLPPFQPTSHFMHNVTGVLYKPHIQKFIRSLRDSLFKYYGERQHFTYFVVGEYGSSKHRPHYHGIIHCDKWEIFDHIKRLIPTFWLYCSKERIEFKRLDGEKFGYLSSYIAGKRNNFGVLSSHDFKEFQLFSKQPIYGVHKQEVEILRDLVAGRDNRIYREVCGQTPDTTSILTLSESILRSFFPRIKGIRDMDDSLLFSIIRECQKSFADRYAIALAARRFIKRFYETDNFTDAHIWLYIHYYRRIYSMLNSYLCQKLNEQVFKRVNFDSILNFYLQHYNTNQSRDVDLYSNEEYIRILKYIHQFDLRITHQFYFRFAEFAKNLLPLNYFQGVEHYVSKFKGMLAPKHTSHIINNF